MSSWSDMPDRSRKRRSFRAVRGGFMSVSGVVLLIGAVYLFGVFADMIAERGDVFPELGGLTLMLIEHRLLIALPAAIAIACGVLLLFDLRPGLRILLLLAGWISLLIPFAALIYTFIAMIAPLYTMREL